MAVTIQDPVAVGHDAFEVRWTSDLTDPLYRVFRNGVLIAVQRCEGIVVTASVDQHDTIVVSDDQTEPAPRIATPTLQVAFLPVAGADSYRLERFIGAAWVQQTTIKETGATQYRHFTDPLPDAGSTQFRMTAIGTANEATPLTGTVATARVPDVPDVSSTFNAGPNTVTIAVAA